MVLDIIIFLALLIALNLLSWIFFIVIDFSRDKLLIANFILFILVGFSQNEGFFLNIILLDIVFTLAIQLFLYKRKFNKRINRDKLSKI